MKKALFFLLTFSILMTLRVSAIEIKSSAFSNGELIPMKYTCDGEDISPPLEWSGFSENTKSFALIVDDPDAPMGVVDHWIVYNIPTDVHSLAENTQNYPQNALGGKNFKGSNTYAGPCPPDKMHRYFFKIYALDEMLPLERGAIKMEVLATMKGHVLEEAELVGQYDRVKKSKDTSKRIDRSD